MERVSIIIPAYNEEERIGKTLEKYLDYFKELKKKKLLGFEIIVVLNACKDNTLIIVKKFLKNRELKILNFKQGGKGFAIIEGFKESLKDGKNHFIGFVDADMSTAPEEFYNLIKGIGEYDGIIASRWMKNSVIKTPQTILRKITSRGFNFLVRSILILPYKDTQCGAKLFKEKSIKNIIKDLKTTRWAFDIDLLYNLKKNGFKLKEVPTVWEDKRESKLSLFKVPFQMFSSVIRLRLIYSPFKFIVKIYDKLPEKMKIHNL